MSLAIPRHGGGAAIAVGFDAMELNATMSGVPFYAAIGYVRVRPVTLSLPDGVVFRGHTMRKTLSRDVARAPAASGMVEHRPHLGCCGEAA